MTVIFFRWRFVRRRLMPAHPKDTQCPRHREGTRWVTVALNQSERDALVVRGYLADEERDNGAAIKKAIEGVLSDLVFELQSETAERTRALV
jgi:hypothetical protein